PDGRGPDATELLVEKLERRLFMQSKDSNTRTAGTVNHPETAAWMALLYCEVSGAKRSELEHHLAECPACATQVEAWRGSMSALDAWTLPARPAMERPFVPVLKWAAAAALVLALGIIVGRQTSGNAAEVAALKKSVADLNGLVQRDNASARLLEEQ